MLRLTGPWSGPGLSCFPTASALLSVGWGYVMHTSAEIALLSLGPFYQFLGIAEFLMQILRGLDSPSSQQGLL